jgi:hypothetical protein
MNYRRVRVQAGRYSMGNCTVPGMRWQEIV